MATLVMASFQLGLFFLYKEMVKNKITPLTKFFLLFHLAIAILSLSAYVDNRW